ncbi:MAG TPA: non-ribosomal peptide synthetase, partial [Candidatus Acidoferrales bacterium]|nr:non-ribosomal peptide synthetase [Candidatus Acidoferrales bacterium]
MGEVSRPFLSLPPEQDAIRAKCYHPTGAFVEFPIEDVETSIPSRFEKIAAKFPGRLAVRVPERQITYNELNKAANRFARSVIAKDDDQRKPIILLLEDGIEEIVAILGLLKAKRFYIPLVPLIPRQRLSKLLRDSGARIIFTDNKHRASLAEFVGNDFSVIEIGECDDSSACDNLGLSISPSDLCAVRYTSGSSGKPKGVMHTHRKVLHAAMANTNALHLCPEDRCAAHGHDYFNSLLLGASFHLAKIAENDWAGFAQWLVDNEITTYDTVPALFRQFCLALNDSHSFPHLRLIKLEGETPLAADVELYKRFFSDDCVLINRLGTRETGGFRQHYIQKTSSMHRPHLSAGYPFGDKDVVLLDDNGSRVTDDQPGEITVVSRYLAAGYWRRPELTRAMFRIDPSSSGYVYRTGDLGIMESDGCLVHLGRKDFQVKIRGNSVDVSDVETALVMLETVKEAVVVVMDDDIGDKRLVGYVVTKESPSPTASSLRNSLKEIIPHFMIPSVFVFLDQLPMTAMGKVDRLALPLPDNSRPRLDVPFVAPRNSVELRLAPIWAEVLGLAQVGVFDNFFHLGGHSLAAMRVVSRVVQTFQLELPIKALFDSPTISEMASIITASSATRASDAELERMLN